MLTSPSRQPVRGVVMAGGLEGGEQVGNERDRMAAPVHRGRDRLGAEIRPAAPRRELEERGDGAELVRRVADGDAAACSSSRSHATSRSWPATRRAHTLARYSARCSVAIAAGGAGKPRTAAGREQPASRAASATAVNQPRRRLRCDALVPSMLGFGRQFLPRTVNQKALRSSSGSLAKFTAIRRASSCVSRFGRRAVRRSDMSGIGREAEARDLHLKRR